MNLDEVARKRLSIVGVTFRTRTHEETAAVVRAATRDLAPMWLAGAAKMPVDSEYAFTDLGRAMHRHAAGDRFGKVVVTLPAAEATTLSNRERQREQCQR